MYMQDIKDFRKYSDYPIELIEEKFSHALVETGTNLTAKPLHLRIRLKDMSPVQYGFLMSKQEIVDGEGCEFRLNLYLPPSWMVGNWEEFLTELNKQIRHDLCHISQVREVLIPAKVAGTEITAEQGEKFETDAVAFGEKYEFELVTN